MHHKQRRHVNWCVPRLCCICAWLLCVHARCGAEARDGGRYLANVHSAHSQGITAFRLLPTHTSPFENSTDASTDASVRVFAASRLCPTRYHQQEHGLRPRSCWGIPNTSRGWQPRQLMRVWPARGMWCPPTTAIPAIFRVRTVPVIAAGVGTTGTGAVSRIRTHGIPVQRLISDSMEVMSKSLGGRGAGQKGIAKRKEYLMNGWVNECVE